MKTVLPLLSAFALWSLVPPVAHAALQQEYEFHNHVRATIGADPCVTVKDLVENDDGPYTQRLVVCDEAKGHALATLPWKAGESHVAIEVVDSEGNVLSPIVNVIRMSPAEVAALVSTALSGNTYFVQAVAVEEPLFYDVFVEFKPEVIQVFVDNIADPYLYAHYVADVGFSQVVNFQGFTSARLHTTISPPPQRLDR